MRIKLFNRYELKYILNLEQYYQFSEILPNYLQVDERGDQHGRYKIISLYYDTDDYKAYWDKVEGHKFRRKVRIRVYGSEPVTPETLCFAEIKQRINKTLQKKRVYIPYAEAEALCGASEDIPSEAKMSEEELAVTSEIRYLQSSLQLRPACVVAYDRMAFDGSEYEDGLRITFDTNLKGRTHDLSLLSHVPNQFFVSPGYCIMEVKVNYRVPYWLTELVGKHGLTLRRISKYCATLHQFGELLRRQQYTAISSGEFTSEGLAVETGQISP
jgi:SPX domain protein involved in polyphosphate accumulation